jgi:hypothetical protein
MLELRAGLGPTIDTCVLGGLAWALWPRSSPAAAALYFSRKAVAEAADLRRSARSDRILDCIGDYAAALVPGTSHMSTPSADSSWPPVFASAAIDAVKTPHPKCRALVKASALHGTQ